MQTEVTEKKAKLMDSFVKDSPNPPSIGDIVEGPIIAKEKTNVYISLEPFGTGIIFGREYLNARDVLKHANIGDSVKAKIVELDGFNGYIELSLKEARQALVWKEAEKAVKNREVFDVLVKDANKGGLMLEWQGVLGFLPASQLKPEHYPRVDDGDKDAILRQLKDLIGQKITVSIITADAKENKLIFSEKSGNTEERMAQVNKYNVGDVATGEVTGSVDFGVFVKLEDNLEGLVHISEMAWSLVEDPKSVYKPGDKIQVKIIDIQDGKVSLSIKALTDNPWVMASKKYKKGDVVSGAVIKHNKHGALVSVEEGVSGLVHISEFENEQKLRDELELGKTYKFKINVFEPNTQRMTLSLVKE